MDENIYKKLRRVLSNMKNRCTNSNDKLYYRYGGRGIKVCDRWTDAKRVGNNPTQGFLNFLEDMGPSYFEDATIDRIDNDGDYTPENCQWLTKSENSRKAQKGRTFSEEHRRKMSEAKQGRKRKPHSDETRQKMSEAKQGRTLSKEHRRKMSEAKQGRTLSKEHRRKISEAAKRYWENKR